ncbi:hypothetical protein B4U80_12793 [Leptotrombidium deliense]|uniref:BTB domain-containing protein n=1 Tax=Leptotrombidium deliense TaxID=299467 RepID=A0A443SLP0_9ACAR|nr:hypothetical protein B4U80_12793 [Leptotrombidium deliense]
MDDSSNNNDTNVDIVLVIEDREIVVPKRELMEKSGYFRSMFEVGMKESEEKRFVISDCRFRLFKYLVDFEFDDLYFVHKETVELIDILTTADFFQFEKIMRFLRDRDSFMKVQQAVVEHFLRRDSFAAPEDVILKSILAYITYNGVTPPDSLLDCVRFNLVSSETLEQLKKNKILKSYVPKNENCAIRKCIVKDKDFADEIYGFTTGFVSLRGKRKRFLMSFNVHVLINCVKVKFNQTYQLNKKKFNVEISNTGEDWMSLVKRRDVVRAEINIDGHKFIFPEFEVKHIRIEVLNKKMKIESFQCLREEDNNSSDLYEKLEYFEEDEEGEEEPSENLFPIKFSQLFNRLCETG